MDLDENREALRKWLESESTQAPETCDMQRKPDGSTGFSPIVTLTMVRMYSTCDPAQSSARRFLNLSVARFH